MTNDFEKVLIANRGEIARRIMRTCRDMGYGTVAVYSEADRRAAFVRDADEAVAIGPAPSTDSYLRIDRIVEAALRTGAGAVHPGYGFLAENAELAAAVEDAGLVFVGPRAETIRQMGEKPAAKALMRSHRVPVIPGHDDDPRDAAELAERAADVGFPLLLKPSAGGGGKGMRVVRAPDELEGAVAAARREARSAFGDDRLLIERYIDRPRHVELQILGDGRGRVIHLFERECSIQRRHQKIIEETPSVALDEDLRSRMAEAAVRAGEALSYRSAGTVEFIVAPDGAFYFLEVNTRLQVEHPITEATTGLDLVRLQLELASGAPLVVEQAAIEPRGHAIECRLYAEDPAAGFLPSSGRLRDFATPRASWLRVDSGVEAGDEVPIYYDPLLAKIIVHAGTRAEATRRMQRALEATRAPGVATNRALLLAVLRHPEWRAGVTDTHFIERNLPAEVLTARRDRGGADEVALRLALVAATVEASAARAAARSVLPATPVAFRNSPWRDAEQGWREAESGLEIEVRYRWLSEDVCRLSIDEATHEARLLGRAAGRLRLELDGRVAGWDVIREGATCWIHGSDGRAFTLHALSRFPEAGEGSREMDCTAPMPGKVLQVLVRAGDEVESGQPLVLVEAMKMEHTVAAPRDAVVDEVLVEEGQLVDADQPVVRFAEGTAINPGQGI